MTVPAPLSPMQRAILAVLPPEHEHAVPTGHVLRAIGIERPTMANRAAITRSLNRLAARDLAVCYVPEICRQGKGYLWGLP